MAGKFEKYQPQQQRNNGDSIRPSSGSSDSSYGPKYNYYRSRSRSPASQSQYQKKRTSSAHKRLSMRSSGRHATYHNEHDDRMRTNSDYDSDSSSYRRSRSRSTSQHRSSKYSSSRRDLRDREHHRDHHRSSASNQCTNKKVTSSSKGDSHRDLRYSVEKSKSRTTERNNRTYSRYNNDGIEAVNDDDVDDDDMLNVDSSYDRYYDNNSEHGSLLGTSDVNIFAYKSQHPNSTIMIRGLAQHITEHDIRQDITTCGLHVKDIRLIRKKETGVSRGFAFVEFSGIADAMRWMDIKQGVLMLQDQYRSIMQYSIPKDYPVYSDRPNLTRVSMDWFCSKCGGQNFKRRDSCFKCHTPKTESEDGGCIGSEEVCSHPTKTIMIRNLDALTTEDGILAAISKVAPNLIKLITASCIGHDPLTTASRGIGYLGTKRTLDALTIYSALHTVPLHIDGKSVAVSYCKYIMGDSQQSYAQHETMAFPNASVPTIYKQSDVNSLAEFSAVRYAKTTNDYIQHFNYYRSYFEQQIREGHSITLLQQQDNQMDAANVAAAVAQSAIQQLKSHQTKSYNNSSRIIPNGTSRKRYPTPDLSTYTYDKTTGYLYDSSTGLYYDPTSNYYWNSAIQKYLYWDSEKSTYVLAPTDAYSNTTTSMDNKLTVATTTAAAAVEHQVDSVSTAPNNAVVAKKSSKSGTEKTDRVKIAKKIAKDMERWAKTLNQKKDMIYAKPSLDQQQPTSTAVMALVNIAAPINTVNNTINITNSSSSNSAICTSTLSSSASTANVCFNLMEKRTSIYQTELDDIMPSITHCEKTLISDSSNKNITTSGILNGNNRAFPMESEQDATTDDVCIYLDFNTLICTLCKRQLGSAEALRKHAKMSTLHTQNLAKRNITDNNIDVDAESLTANTILNNEKAIMYRDRAKERRQKYGDDEELQTCRLKDKYMKSLDDSKTTSQHTDNTNSSVAKTAEPISASNVGSKLLQKMGWSEGQGLGRLNQGRTSIIEAEKHCSTAGLGTKLAGYTPVVGDNYKDCVRKMMFARYQEIAEREN